MDKPLAIILAAGKGKRMGSELPKVLVPVCGRPMIHYVIDAVRAAGVQRMVVIVGYRADLVRRELAGEAGLEFAVQAEQLGTGHAVMVCRERLELQEGPALIVAGDSPMIQSSSLKAILAEYAKRRPACLLGTANKPNPTGLGRIVRTKSGEFSGIVEEKEATPAERAITEVNLSTYVFRPDALVSALQQLTANNAQGEYYLTDCPGVLKTSGERVEALCVLKPCEALSINTPEELKAVEDEMEKLRIADCGLRIPEASNDNPKSEIRNPKSK
jgi:bifunctional UDP-N-acetylglucosamine pyrophosphorylase / glucosamine-1-phosphate N-acetyltransferase